MCSIWIIRYNMNLFDLLLYRSIYYTVIKFTQIRDIIFIYSNLLGLYQCFRKQIQRQRKWKQDNNIHISNQSFNDQRALNYRPLLFILSKITNMKNKNQPISLLKFQTFRLWTGFILPECNQSITRVSSKGPFSALCLLWYTVLLVSPLQIQS